MTYGELRLIGLRSDFSNRSGATAFQTLFRKHGLARQKKAWHTFGSVNSACRHGVAFLN